MAKLKNRLNELVEERKAQGQSITQTDIAAAAGISQATVSRWMSGKVDRFDSRIIENLCKYLKCEVGELLYIDWEGEKAS